MTEHAGTYSDYARERALALGRQERAYADFVEERDRFGTLLGARREQARHGVHIGQRETQALKSKVAQAKRRLERLEEVEKPWRAWRLELALAPDARSGDVVARLAGAVIERGGFRLGPIELDVGWGDRFAIVGRNGSGKTTLLRALVGDLPLARGERTIGKGVVFRRADQRRELSQATSRSSSFRRESALRSVSERCSRSSASAVTTCFARQRRCPRASAAARCSRRRRHAGQLPDPRRATNHLDLEATEQLETALADYAEPCPSRTTGASNGSRRRER